MEADPKQTHVAAEWAADAPLINCRFDPKGLFVFATAEDRTVVRWELASGKRTVMRGHESWARGMAFTPDGATLLTGGCDDTLIWWPAAAENPEPARKVKAHEGWIRSVAVSPDGALAASAGNDGKVRLWNVADGSLVRELTGHEGAVYSVLFHPSGQFLLSGDLKGQVHQWNVATGERAGTFDAKALYSFNAGQGVDYGGVRSLALGPDGTHLACAGLTKAENPLGAVNEPLAIRFEWESRKAIRNHASDGVKGVAWRALFHPSGLLIACSGGSGGGVLLFWNADQDQAFHKVGLPNTAREMDLHPDGIQLAVAHYDRKLRLYRMAAKA